LFAWATTMFPATTVACVTSIRCSIMSSMGCWFCGAHQEGEIRVTISHQKKKKDKELHVSVNAPE
jgi:hypothetical protein